MSDSRPAPGWLRRNAWALALLPFLLVAVVAANSIRVHDYWWSAGLRSATAGQQGHYVTHHDNFSDALGDLERTVRVRLDALTEISAMPRSYGEPIPVPPGTAAYRVDLSFAADPDQYLRGCQLALAAADGQRFVFDADLDVFDQDEPSPCVQLDAGGPETAFLRGMQRNAHIEEPRPPTWRMSPVVFVPEGTKITEVLIWWEKPHHVRLQVRR